MSADYNLGTARGVIEIAYNGDGATRAQRDLTRTGQSADKINPALDKTGTVAGLAGLAIAGGFALAAKSAGDFEKQMSGIAAVSGASDTQLEALRSKALQLGKDTQYSASESAQAIEELVKAGISVPDVLNGAADSVVALAAAGAVSMPEAATIAANAMNQFNIPAKDMKGVVDNIAGAANASAIDVGEFGMSLQQVGAVANLAGVSFKDTATAIALMGNAGVKSSDAGTSLKTMFQRLQPTTNDQVLEMKRLGLLTLDANKAMQTLRNNGVRPLGTDQETLNKQLAQLGARLSSSKVGSDAQVKATQDLMLRTGALSNAFYDAHGKTKSLADVSQVLQNALKGMNEQQKQATLTTLFGSDAIRGAAILANNGAAGFNKMAGAMGKVSAADVAKKRMDNFDGSLEQMKGSLETAGIAVGTMLLPALRQVVDGITSMLNAFLSLPGGAQAVIATVAGVVGILLLVVGAIVKFIKIQKILQLALAGTRLEFIATWFAALGPIALVIAAVLAIVAVVVILWKKSETFRNIVLGVWDAIKTAALAVANWFAGPFVNFFVGVWNAIQSGLSAIGGFFVSVWNGIKSVVSAVVGAIATVIRIYITIWLTIFQTVLGVLMAVWRAFWNTFGGLIKAVFGLIVALFHLYWTIIRGVFLLYLQSLLFIARTVWNAIVAVFQFVWNIIRAVVTAGVNAVRAVVTAVWNAIRAASSAVWNGILAVIRAVWGAIGGTVMGAVNRVRAVVVGAWNAVRSATSAVWNGLRNIVSSAINALMGVVNGIKGRVLGALSGAGRWLLDSGKKIIQGLIDGIESMIKNVTGSVKKVTGVISRFLPHSPVEEGPLRVLNRGHAGKSIVRMVIDGIEEMRAPLERTLATVIQLPNLGSDLGRVGSASAVSLAGSAAGSAGAGSSAGTMAAPSRHRLVEGRLTLDPSGRAFISGVAEDVYDGNERFAASYGRMAG